MFYSTGSWRRSRPFCTEYNRSSRDGSPVGTHDGNSPYQFESVCLSADRSAHEAGSCLYRYSLGTGTTATSRYHCRKGQKADHLRESWIALTASSDASKILAEHGLPASTFFSFIENTVLSEQFFCVCLRDVFRITYAYYAFPGTFNINICRFYVYYTGLTHQS